jgi:hypothetical protein
MLVLALHPDVKRRRAPRAPEERTGRVPADLRHAPPGGAARRTDSSHRQTCALTRLWPRQRYMPATSLQAEEGKR